MLFYIDENPDKVVFISAIFKHSTSYAKDTVAPELEMDGPEAQRDKEIMTMSEKFDSGFMVWIYNATFDFLVYTQMKPPTIPGGIIEIK